MIKARPADLPEFSDPPVAETVLSVQFDRLSALRTAHFGLYWGGVQDRFPVTEEHGELPSILERSPDELIPMVGIQFEAFEAPPTRFWFVDRLGTELIQVQRDRFIKNWRKLGEGDQYPRYERIRAGFDRDFYDFSEFVTRNQLGKLRVNQYEVTYINHIVAGRGWDSHADVGQVFTVWQQPRSVYPGQAQDLTFRTRFPILDPSGNFAGRLHVTLQSAKRLSDGAPMFVLELTARGLLEGDSDFFGLGREWIVRSFAELTTPKMHKIWGRRS
jgi:uncharacterized protein (TIGR04255 family)